MENQISSMGGAPSLIESFSISGLHGYRTISIDSPTAATVLIAQNGSGKTTLLGALDAFLKGQFGRLTGLDFVEIRCKLRGADEFLLLKSDLVVISEAASKDDVVKFARECEVDASKVVEFLLNDFDRIRDSVNERMEDLVYAAAIRRSRYDHGKANEFLESLRDGIFPSESRLRSIRDALRILLSGIEVIYLPTYRRIEVPFSSGDDSGPPGRRRSARLRPPAGIPAGDIQFGLADIAARLQSLNQSILIKSDQGYREISAAIINELVQGTADIDTSERGEVPTSQELKLFFSRMREGARSIRYSLVSIPEIEEISTGDHRNEKYLFYFLRKLNTVIQATRSIEVQVQQFVQMCNKYLSQRDVSADFPSQDSSASSYDLKELVLDRQNFRVHAVSIPSRRKIPLDVLSSGEKQMVSLFGKIVLYPHKKIILIDEPELSLSIDWQRHILPDIVGFESCLQLVAITHSPFVFQNQLEPYARSLRLSLDLTRSPIDSESSFDSEATSQ